MDKDVQDRRPVSTRNARWAGVIAQRLQRAGATPNGISVASMVFALLAALCFAFAFRATGTGTVQLCMLGAVVGIQGRLLCNLFDGMVAVEAGRGAPDGAFWNEFPDRVSDALILLGAGLFVADPTLGWAAAAMAFLTAYIRELGANCGYGADFSGPMAKQHRMAMMTGAALLSVLEPLWGWSGQILTAALWVVAVGAGLTALRRALRLVLKMRAGGLR